MQAETKPNVIVILADDMGIGDPGCYGSKQIPTPNMDRVAAEGIRFTDAHSSSSARETLIHHSGGGMFAIRCNEWKLIAGNGSGGFSNPVGELWLEPWQLYNLREDPSEQTNLIEKRPDIVGDLKTLLKGRIILR